MARIVALSNESAAVVAVYAEQPEAGVAFALAFPEGELPRLVYWGRPMTHPETVVDAADALRPQRVSGALDYTPWPSVLPTQAEAWIGEPRLALRRDGVEVFCRFTVTDTTVTEGDRPAVTVTAEDAEQQVALTWTMEIDPSGLLRQRAAIRNLAYGELEIGKVELGFAVPGWATEILTTTGHHLRERSPQRQPLTIGRFQRTYVAGRPDFDASLLLTVGAPGFGFEHGEVYSTHVAWSGNSLLSAERLPYTQPVIGGGEILFGGEVTLPHDGAYETPWVYGAYGDGLNEVASRFHRYVRSCHPEMAIKPRPVILNTWEAVYFDQNYDTLVALADKAADSGVERFVVDDGWFGSRRDDTSGLGDWQIAQSVWPEGPKSLKALADYVHGKGMQFGLWFEPEMVNPDSEMFRNHPDWVLKPTANRLPMQGRCQQVVDLTNPEAYDYVYDCMDKLVEELGIDYIKWDHNKLVTEAFSPENARPAVHEQTLAVYRIFRDLKAAHPGLEIESCSSGGARTDAGILLHADRIWGSDSNDPRDRVDIQRWTELIVPPEMIGAHVGPSPAHSTGRATDLSYRAAISLEGCSGFEWNILECPDEQVEQLRSFVALYKELRGLLHTGRVMHADMRDPSLRARGVANADRTHAVWVVASVDNLRDALVDRLHVGGLDPERVYRVRQRREIGESKWGWITPQWLTAARGEDGFTVSGRLLEQVGLQLPNLWPMQAIVLEFEAE